MLLNEIIELPERYPIEEFEATIIDIKPSYSHDVGQVATLIDNDTKISAFFFNRQNLDGLDGERLLFKGFDIDKQLRQLKYNNSYKIMPDLSIHMWYNKPQIQIKKSAFIKRLTKTNVKLEAQKDLTQKDYDDLKKIQDLCEYLKEDLLTEQGKIYRILNKITGEIYIGRTRQLLEKRFDGHINDTRCSFGGETPLQRALVYYGEENFKMELLYCCKYREELTFVESFLIKRLDTMIPHGYNVTYNKKENKVLMNKMISSYDEL